MAESDNNNTPRDSWRCAHFDFTVFIISRTRHKLGLGWCSFIAPPMFL